MIDYATAPENVRRLALVFLETAGVTSALNQPGNSPVPARLVASTEATALSAREAAQAARWLAEHYLSARAQTSVAATGICLLSVAAAWSAYAGDLEKLAAAGK
jgi:hypothetical protein